MIHRATVHGAGQVPASLLSQWSAVPPSMPRQKGPIITAFSSFFLSFCFFSFSEKRKRKKKDE
uniref:Uncharacterized protein n=1 Tax=Arundo donax TaxID=35708 RepID=A0A0A8YAQ5_ARUDO